MRVGIVGFGKMGMLHGALLNKLEGVEVVAVADTSKLMLIAFKSVLPKIKYFNSYEKMFSKCKLDAVIIATPSFTHVPIAKSAIENSISVFIEKPLSSTLEQAVELHNLLKGKDVVSMVGFCMRYIPTFIKGKEILDSKKMGNIKKVNSQIYIADVFEEQIGWRYNKTLSGGGVLIDFSVHMIDLLYYYFGQVKSVNGEIKSIYSKKVEDEVTAELLFENGVTAKLDSSWSKPEYRKTYARIEIEGDKGKMVVSDQNLVLEMYDENTKEYIIESKWNYPDLYEGYYVDIGGPLYSTQMELFVDIVKNKRKSDVDIERSLHTQKIIDTIYKSAEQKKQISIDGD